MFQKSIITLIFVALADFAFNEESNFCMLPTKYKNFDHILDANGDGIIDEEELKKAKELIAKAEEENKKKNQKKQMLRFHELTK